MKKRFPPFVGIFIVALLALLLAFAFVVVPWMNSFAFKNYTPQMKKIFEEWRTKPLALPPEATSVRPYSTELALAATQVREAWEFDGQIVNELLMLPELREWTRAVHRGEARLEGMPEVGDAEMTELAVYIEAYERMVTLDDYGVEAAGAGQSSGTPFGGLPNYLALQNGAKLLRLKALRLARAGDLPKAFEVARALLLSSRTETYSVLISHLIGIAVLSISMGTWDLLIQECDDPELLREQLAFLNAYAPRAVFMDASLSPEDSDQLGSVRLAMRGGYRANLSAVTGAELMAIALDINAEQIRQNGPANRLKQNRQWAASIRGEFPYIGPFGRMMQAKIFAISRPNFIEAYVRHRTAQTKFDLVRVRAAKKLYRLERGTEPEKIEDLAPDYLPEPLIDRFTTPMPSYVEPPAMPLGAPLPTPFSPLAIKPVAYSIGPDLVDGGALTLYDPSNGTRSAGDVFFVRSME